MPTVVPLLPEQQELHRVRKKPFLSPGVIAGVPLLTGSWKLRKAECRAMRPPSSCAESMVSSRAVVPFPPLAERRWDSSNA